MKTTNNTMNVTVNKNMTGLMRKAVEYGIYDEALSYEELSLKVNGFENNILKAAALFTTGESLTDEDVKEMNVEQIKAKKIIKSMGSNFQYALNLYAEAVGNQEILTADLMSLDYDTVCEIRELYNEKISWKTHPKRENWSCVQVYINNIDNQNTFDSSHAVDITEFDNKRAAAASGRPVRVPITVTRAKKNAEIMGLDLIVVKMVPGEDASFSDPYVQMMLNATNKISEIEQILEEKRRSIIENGITDRATGKHYHVAVRSAAQSRNGSFWFCESNTFEEVDEFRRRCCCLSQEEWAKTFGDVVYMSKMEARIGLSVSSVLDIREVTKACRQENFIKIIEDFNVKVIPDVYNEIVVKTVKPVFNARGEFEGQMTTPTDTKIDSNVSDGCGLISVDAIIKCNYALNLISDKDYHRALELFEKYGRSLSTFKSFEPTDPTSKEFKDYSWFESFVIRLHKVLQFRHAGDKGILVMADLEYYGIQEDILIHESTRKYDFGKWSDAPLEICNYDKHKTGKANMNFQFWNALNISNENMESIVNESLEYVNEKVLEDPNHAMKFLGMISKVGDDSEEEMDTIIKLNTVLKTDPSMINDKQVQKWLSTKVSKFLDDLSIGRIPVEGAYYYIVTDPRYLIAKYLGRDDIDYLKTKENYLNGYEGFVGAFRAPLIHKSEAQKLNCVKADELWFYTDILIFNPFDGTAQAMGGADFDGDRALATKDQRIWEAICTLGYLIYDEGISADKVKNTWKNRIDFFTKTSVPDKTGYITNLATKWSDLSHNYRIIGDSYRADIYDRCVIALRFLQGWEIDSAKTGKNAEAIGFPKSLKEAKTPHHFIGMRELQNRSVTVKDENRYNSKAPMGHLFDYVQSYRKDHMTLEKKTRSKTQYLCYNLSPEEVEASSVLLPKIQEIERSYRRDIAGVTEMKDSMDKGTFMNALSVISEKYQNQVYSLIDDTFTEKVVTFTAYFAAYNRDNNESQSCSFPWNCLFDSMILLLSQSNKQVRMYRIPERVIKEDKEIESCKIENFNLIVNEKVIGSVPCNKNMDLTITVIDNKPFVVVPVTEVKLKEEVRELATMDKTFGFSVNGFRFTQAVHCENFLGAVKANGNVFDIIFENDELTVQINGYKYGTVSSQSTLSALANTRVIMVSHGDTVYAPKRITQNTLMKDETLAYKGQIDVEVTPVQLIGEDMRSTGYYVANKATQAPAQNNRNDYANETYMDIPNDMDFMNEMSYGVYEDEYVQAAALPESIPFEEDMSGDYYGSDITFDDEFEMI